MDSMLNAIKELEIGSLERSLVSPRVGHSSFQVRSADDRSLAVRFIAPNPPTPAPVLSGPMALDHPLLAPLARQDHLARQAGDLFIAGFERMGLWSGRAFGVREWSAYSLRQLIEAGSRPRSSDDLFYLVHNVWTAICFLHQPKINLPHGNIKPANVLIPAAWRRAFSHRLTDLAQLPESEHAAAKTADMRALGLMIVQYCEGTCQFPTLEAAGQCAQAARWAFLGAHQAEWKRICQLLLHEDHYKANYDPEEDRHALLRPIRPKDFRIAVVPPPLPVQPHLRIFLLSERLRAARRQFHSGRWRSALDQLCELETECREGEGATLHESIAAELADVVNAAPPLASSPQAVAGLEKAAAAGSAPAAYRLGEHWREKDAARALPWFKRAAELGMAEALVLLGDLCQTGSSSLPADLAAAAEHYESAISRANMPEAKMRLAILILRRDASQPLNRAIDLLKDAAAAKVHGAGGLLGLCFAAGLGVPRNLDAACHWFSQAWLDTENTEHPDFTALNNLAVCRANGFGVPSADIPLAIRELERAAAGGCKGAHRNLATLPRRIYLRA